MDENWFGQFVLNLGSYGFKLFSKWVPKKSNKGHKEDVGSYGMQINIQMLIDLNYSSCTTGVDNFD